MSSFLNTSNIIHGPGFIYPKAYVRKFIAINSLQTCRTARNVTGSIRRKVASNPRGNCRKKLKVMPIAKKAGKNVKCTKMRSEFGKLPEAEAPNEENSIDFE